MNQSIESMTADHFKYISNLNSISGALPTSEFIDRWSWSPWPENFADWGSLRTHGAVQELVGYANTCSAKRIYANGVWGDWITTHISCYDVQYVNKSVTFNEGSRFAKLCDIDKWQAFACGFCTQNDCTVHNCALSIGQSGSEIYVHKSTSTAETIPIKAFLFFNGNYKSSLP